MIIIGIDPGLSGAIATINLKGKPLRIMLMPVVKVGKRRQLDEQAIREFFERRILSIEHIFIEKVHSMPGQGVVSTFTFGTGWGILRGLCAGLHLPYTLVAPTTWKRSMCRDVPKGKGASVLIAKRLWPNINLKPTPRSKKDNNGLADAICIAEYGRRLHKGEKE